MTRRLEAMLQPGEAVALRLPVAHRIVGVWIALILLAAVLLFAPPLYFADLVLDERLTRLVRILALFLIVVPGTILLIPLGGALSERSGLLLTDRRFIWRDGALGGRARYVDRAGIASLTLYEGHGRLYLDRTDGANIRLRGARLEESRAARLGVPVRIWPIPSSVPGGEPVWKQLEGGLTAGISTLGFGVVLYPLWWDVKIRDDPLSTLLALLATIALVSVILVLLLAARIAVVEPLRHRRARRRLDAAELHRFACHEFCRLCQGREPYPETGGTLWDRLERRADRWLIDKFYGGRLDCDCAPKVIAPQA